MLGAGVNACERGGELTRLPIAMLPVSGECSQQSFFLSVSVAHAFDIEALYLF